MKKGTRKFGKKAAVKKGARKFGRKSVGKIGKKTFLNGVKQVKNILANRSPITKQHAMVMALLHGFRPNVV